MKINNHTLETRFTELNNLIFQRVTQEDCIKYASLPKTSTLFQDVHGKNLFHYAIQLQSLDKLKTLIDRLKIDIANKIVTDFEINKMLYHCFKTALRTDNLAIVSFFYNLQLPSVEPFKESIALQLKPHLMANCKENCRSFLEVIFQEKFSILSAAAKTTGEPLSHELLLYAIMNKNKKFIIDSDLSFLSKSKNIHLLISLIKAAIKTDNTELIAYLVQKNLGCVYDNNLLHLALTHASYQTVNYLLANFSEQLINEVDVLGNAPLIHAIKHNAPSELIETLLDKKPNLYLVTVECNTIFHQIARFGSTTHLKQIAKTLGTVDTLKLISEKNIYNQNALDIAFHYQKQENCVFFENACNFNLRNEVSFANNPCVIQQSKILRKMSYYLALSYQRTEFFIEGGHCNGFGFLYLYYNALGKRDYFFSIMSELAAWDGQLESLKRPLTTYSRMPHQEPLYRNLGELFEQWINDVIWFQQSSEAFEQITPISQSDRTKQLINAQEMKGYNNLECRPIFCSYPFKNLETPQLIELLHLSSTLPEGSCIELYGLVGSDGMGHLVVLTVELNGFSFYDSNRPFIPNSVLTLKQVIHLLNGLSFYKSASYSYQSYQLVLTGAQPPQSSLDDFYRLLNSERKNLDPKFRTPKNNYSLSHLAILTSNYAALTLLLETNHFVWVNDFHGETAWSLAMKNNNLNALVLIIYSELQRPNPNIKMLQDVFAAEELLELLKEDTVILTTLLKKLTDYINTPATRSENTRLKQTRIAPLLNQIKVGLIKTYSFEAYFPILRQLSDNQLLTLLDQPFNGQINLVIYLAKNQQYHNVRTILEHLPASVGHCLLTQGWYFERATVFSLLSDKLTLENFKKLTTCYPKKTLGLLLNGCKPNASTFIEFFAEKEQFNLVLAVLKIFLPADVDLYLANNRTISDTIDRYKTITKTNNTNSNLTIFSKIPIFTCKPDEPENNNEPTPGV